MFERKRRHLTDASASKRLQQTRGFTGEDLAKPAQMIGSRSDEVKLNAFGMPVDDTIDIGDILKVSLQENSLETTTVLQVVQVGEVANKRDNFSLGKLGKINSSLYVRSESGALLGKRESVLQENEAPQGTIWLTLVSRPAKHIKMADIYEGFRKGKLSWDQLVFNKETVEYLQRNLSTMLSDN